MVAIYWINTINTYGGPFGCLGGHLLAKYIWFPFRLPWWPMDKPSPSVVGPSLARGLCSPPLTATPPSLGERWKGGGTRSLQDKRFQFSPKSDTESFLNGQFRVIFNLRFSTWFFVHIWATLIHMPNFVRICFRIRLCKKIRGVSDTAQSSS